MNNFDSPPYRPRWLEPALTEASREHPVVVLTGARQVGKSTVLQHAAPFRDWRYRSLDDLDVLAQARDDPAGLWAGVDAIVLDEVQRAPTVLHAVKRAVDSDRGRRFVLSGSANLLLMQHVGESLAGRAVTFHLGPMTVGEIAGVAPPSLLADALSGTWPPETIGQATDPLPWLLRGLMPALLTVQTPAGRLRWWEGYVQTYLERDLRQMAQIADLADFRRLMALLALRCGQLLNQSDIARDAGLSQPTAHRYIGLLEMTHLFHRLPSFAGSRTTQLVKSPRGFWSDPALAVFLSGYYDLDSLRASRELGGFFEALVFVHLAALAEQLVPRARLSFWRTRATGAEVDFVVTHGRRQLAIEVKLTERPGVRHTAGLKRFIDAQPGSRGLLVHAGDATIRLAEDIVAVPWTALGGVDGAMMP